MPEKTTDAIIEVRDLYKKYPRVTAVDGISFSVKTGICFGMLGPNGAGKTTTIEILEGIHSPSAGTILYKGKPQGRVFKEEIGIQFQSTALQEHQSCFEVLKMFSALYSRQAPLDDIISRCNLEEFIHQDVHKLSGGQRQRLLLAAALVNDPEIIFLDEPTTGLDPQARQNFWNIVRHIKQQGKTLILTTHYMEEAYALCDELIIMDHGKIIARGSPGALLEEYFEGATLKFPSSQIDIKQIPESLAAHFNGESIEMHVNDTDAAIRILLENGVNLSYLTIQKQTLEDLFLHLTSQGNA